MSEPEYTGKDVSYYLVKIESPKRLDPYTAECEDIIEALGMTFAEGCAFKAIWRKCAARTLGIAKAGYKGGLYDAEKTQYYGGRMVAAELRVAAHDPAHTETPVTFSQVCAEIDTAIQEAVESGSIAPHSCPHCGRQEGEKHRRGCPTISTPTDQLPRMWDADCDVECFWYYPGFTVGKRYGLLAVNHESHTVTLYSDDKTIAVFGFKEITSVFKLHSRPAK